MHNGLDKYKINEMLNRIPNEYDVEITIVKTLGDSLTFFNYEKHMLRLFDDYLLFYEPNGGKEYKIMYGNIIQFKWKPVFKGKIFGMTVDGEIKDKGE